MALQAITMMIGRRLAIDVAKYENQCTLHVIPPLCLLAVRPHDFSQAAELMARAYESTRRWLEGGIGKANDQVRLVRPHVHAELMGAAERGRGGCNGRGGRETELKKRRNKTCRTRAS